MAESTDHSSSRPELPTELHQATRAEHASLNRAIVARLPLCVPPHATSSFAYAAGMTVFSHIYTAFEETWNLLLQDDSPLKPDPRQKELLCTLQTKHIFRTERIRSDLENLKRSLGPNATHALDILHTSSEHFHTAICNSIQARPHLALAYTWTMYLALFNGGRWIVKQLTNPGTSYWFNEASSEAIAEKYLSFWFFDDTPRDERHGETVKINFKRNFNAAAALLTDTERDDVITESKALFGMCADMVALLDQETSPSSSMHCGGPATTTKTNRNTTGPFSSYLSTILPVSGVWQSLRAVIRFPTTQQPASPDDTIKA